MTEISGISSFHLSSNLKSKKVNPVLKKDLPQLEELADYANFITEDENRNGQNTDYPNASWLLPSKRLDDNYLKNWLTTLKNHQVNLQGIDLQNTNLEKADLRGVSFLEANLSGANLENCCLKGAKLSRANVTDTKLSNADLTAANLFQIQHNIVDSLINKVISVLENPQAALTDDLIFSLKSRIINLPQELESTNLPSQLKDHLLASFKTSLIETIEQQVNNSDSALNKTIESDKENKLASLELLFRQAWNQGNPGELINNKEYFSSFKLLHDVESNKKYLELNPQPPRSVEFVLSLLEDTLSFLKENSTLIPEWYPEEVFPCIEETIEGLKKMPPIKVDFEFT